MQGRPPSQRTLLRLSGKRKANTTVSGVQKRELSRANLHEEHAFLGPWDLASGCIGDFPPDCSALRLASLKSEADQGDGGGNVATWEHHDGSEEIKVRARECGELKCPVFTLNTSLSMWPAPVKSSPPLRGRRLLICCSAIRLQP